MYKDPTSRITLFPERRFFFETFFIQIDNNLKQKTNRRLDENSHGLFQVSNTLPKSFALGCAKNALKKIWGWFHLRYEEDEKIMRSNRVQN